MLRCTYLYTMTTGVCSDLEVSWEEWQEARERGEGRSRLHALRSISNRTYVTATVWWT